MAGFTESITRSMVPIPIEQATEIIQDLPKSSVILDRARRTTMSTKTRTQPVLSVLPQAYWVGSDIGLKETSHAEWGNLTLTAEELAVLVPVPDAVIADSNIPIWSEVRPLIAEAIGRAIDQAALWGINKPSSWPTALVPGAVNAGNYTAVSTSSPKADVGKAAADAGFKVSGDGFAVNGFAAQPGLNWELVGLRDQNGQQVYSPSIAAGQPSTLYGYPLNEVLNGSFDPTIAKLILADWSKLILGMRQDMTFKMLDQSVITDTNGKVVFNASQQDAQIMRVVMRVGFQIANPVTRVNDGTPKYPAGVVVPETAVWKATTDYPLGASLVKDNTILKATTAGKSGSSAPTVPAAVGGTVTDGTTVWTRQA